MPLNTMFENISIAIWWDLRKSLFKDRV